jgi:hypothetical protein
LATAAADFSIFLGGVFFTTGAGADFFAEAAFALAGFFVLDLETGFFSRVEMGASLIKLICGV